MQYGVGLAQILYVCGLFIEYLYIRQGERRKQGVRGKRWRDWLIGVVMMGGVRDCFTRGLPAQSGASCSRYWRGGREHGAKRGGRGEEGEV